MAPRRYVIIHRSKTTREIWEVGEGESYVFSNMVGTATTDENAKKIRDAFDKEPANG